MPDELGRALTPIETLEQSVQGTEAEITRKREHIACDLGRLESHRQELAQAQRLLADTKFVLAMLKGEPVSSKDVSIEVAGGTKETTTESTPPGMRDFEPDPDSETLTFTLRMKGQPESTATKPYKRGDPVDLIGIRLRDAVVDFVDLPDGGAYLKVIAHKNALEIPPGTPIPQD